MTRDRGSVRSPLLGSQSETVVGQRLSCWDSWLPVHAYRDHSFQAIGNSKVTPPLSLPVRPRPQHWNRPGRGVRQRIFRGYGWWSRRSLGGAWDYFRLAPPGPGLRRPVLDTVSDFCRCASVPAALHSFPSSPDIKCRTGFAEGMALSGQGDAGGIFRGPLTSSVPTARDAQALL